MHAEEHEQGILGFEPTREARESVRKAEKTRIAKAALAALPDEGTILIDAGSTTARLAEELPANRELTVVTHSLDIAFTLSKRDDLTVMFTGGRLRARTVATVGDWTLHALGQTFVDVAFLATNGLSIEWGLTTPDAEEAAVKRAAIANSRRCVLVADHTKVGRNYRNRFADLCEIDTFVTDSGLGRAALKALDNTGPRIIVA